MRCTGAEALVRLLTAEGVSLAFGIASGKLGPVMHALSRQDAIRFVGVRHEAAAAMMAAAVHAGTGRMAVAFGEMGPGALNLAAGTGIARNNNLAAMLVTTNQHRAASYPHSGMFMDLATRDLLAPLVKWNAVVGDARRIPELVRTAFREALSGRPGPVHLDVPHDVLSETVELVDGELDVQPARYRSVHPPRAADDAIAAAAELLLDAKRPLIVAGGGVVAANAVDPVRALAAMLEAPVVPTQMALGVVASDSRHFIGHGGLIAGEPVIAAFAEADVVLSVGCRHSSWLWDAQGPLVRREHRHININIDASALGRPAHHDLAIHADARLALIDLIALLDRLAAAGARDTRRPRSDPGWLASLRERRSRYEQSLAALADSADAPQAADDDDHADAAMHPAALARAIGLALPADALAVFDGGHTSFWSNDLTPVQAPRTRFHDPGMSQLGMGLPYALALQLVHPESPVFNITGDGSFGFTLQELDTARRHALPVITVIHNNAAWGIIRAGQRKQFDFEFATGLEGTDYAAIARGFGCHGETVVEATGVGPAIERALAAKRPAVIDCRTRFVPHPAMPAFARMNQYGFDALTRIHSQTVVPAKTGTQ